MNSRDVTGRRDHTAPAAADDHRLFGQIRVIALFNAGVKGVTIKMGQAQVGEFAIADLARTSASRAAPADRQRAMAQREAIAA